MSPIRGKERDVRVLVADGDIDNRSLLVDLLQGRGYLTSEADDAAEAEEQLREPDIDLVILDAALLRLSPADGLKETIRANRTPMILLTGMGCDAGADLVESFGVSACLTKPLNLDVLMERIARVMETPGAMR